MAVRLLEAGRPRGEPQQQAGSKQASHLAGCHIQAMLDAMRTWIRHVLHSMLYQTEPTSTELGCIITPCIVHLHGVQVLSRQLNAFAMRAAFPAFIIHLLGIKTNLQDLQAWR